jgi:hypothetical protein
MYRFSDRIGYPWVCNLHPNRTDLNCVKPILTKFRPVDRTDPPIYTRFFTVYSVFGWVSGSVHPYLLKTSWDWYFKEYKLKASYIGETPENNIKKTPPYTQHLAIIKHHHLKQNTSRKRSLKLKSSIVATHPKTNTHLNATSSRPHKSWATSVKLLFERSFCFHHLSTSDPPKERQIMLQTWAKELTFDLESKVINPPNFKTKS